MRGLAENSILLEEEEDKKDSPPTPVSGRPTRPLALLRSLSFGTRIENVSDYAYRSLFQ